MISPNSLESESRRRTLIIVAIIVLAKSILAAITPGSSDFRWIATSAHFAPYPVVFYGPYTFSVYFMNLINGLWLLIPIDHQWIYGKNYSFIPSSTSFFTIFIFKLPLLIFDILTALVIYEIVSLLTRNRRMSTLAALIWFLNPYLTVIIEMDGTIDIISTFLVVFATYLFIRGKDVVSGVCLAIATLARFYPVVLVPFYALFLLKANRLRNIGLMVASYLVTLTVAVTPVVAAYGTSFLNTVYELPVGNKEFTWFFGFMPTVASTSETRISSVATVLVVLALLMNKVWKPSRQLVLDAILITLITYVGLSHWNRYYTVWVIPFLTVDLAMNLNGKHKKVYTALFALFFLSAFVYNFAYWWNELLFIHQFTPQMAEMTAFTREIGEILRMGDLGTTFSQSILAGACVIYAAIVTTRNAIRRD